MAFLLFIIFGLPCIGGFLTWMVSRLYGPQWTSRFPPFLLVLLLLSTALALINPTFEWGMRGALSACALIPILIGSVLTSFLLRLRTPKANQEEQPGFSRSRD